MRYRAPVAGFFFSRSILRRGRSTEDGADETWWIETNFVLFCLRISTGMQEGNVPTGVCFMRSSSDGRLFT